ncbi:MAG: hypothetical protein AB7T86_05720 [Xanthobacteraceae bacterium]|uniref:hypothetical protein n=1 Tax=Pseudolabrys sp. TaxID=1960880 RepID=UPI003D12D88B
MSDHGILAIWNDARPGREGDFETWFQGEHIEERLAVPGFLFGRRHRAISGSNGYFNFYLTQTPATLTSRPYLERLDNPTPMTRMIMEEVFANMNRTVCRRAYRHAGFRGAYAVTARFSAAPDEAALKAEIARLAADPARVVNGEIWIALDPTGMPVSKEEQLRGGDKKIAGCLMIDTLQQKDAEAIGVELAQKFPDTEVGVFRVLCQLGRGDL